MTDLVFKNIHPIGLGTGTGFKKIDDKRDKHLIYILQKAFSLGINFIDTAEVYFDGNSEKLIGKAFKKNRSKVYVATKFSPEHSKYKDVLKAAEGSLKRLNTDYIDLYQIHWPYPIIPIAETLEALKKLVDSGKVRNIGVCNFSLRQLKDFQKATKMPIFSLQTEYNLLERSIELNLLPFCQKNKITTIAYTPLNSGNILKNKKCSKIFSMLSKKYNRSESQIILNFLISHPYVIAIPATTNAEHLEENSKANEFKLEKEDIELISKSFALKIINIDTSKIKVITIGDHAAYRTIKEAKINRLNFSPSPLMLSKELKKGDFLKAVRVRALKKKEGNFEYELVGGRIRYWAYVLAYNGKKRIPAIVEEE